MDKAATSLSSARILLDAGDADGSCNRAYYAMFDSARAALAAIGQEPSSVKTHSTVIRTFGLHFVKTGRIPRDIGKSLNEAFEIRVDADYGVSAVSVEDARATVERAEAFVVTVSHFLREIGGPKEGT